MVVSSLYVMRVGGPGGIDLALDFQLITIFSGKSIFDHNKLDEPSFLPS
jgi:hypothetical protein